MWQTCTQRAAGKCVGVGESKAKLTVVREAMSPQGHAQHAQSPARDDLGSLPHAGVARSAHSNGGNRPHGRIQSHVQLSRLHLGVVNGKQANAKDRDLGRDAKVFSGQVADLIEHLPGMRSHKRRDVILVLLGQAERDEVAQGVVNGLVEVFEAQIGEQRCLDGATCLDLIVRQIRQELRLAVGVARREEYCCAPRAIASPGAMQQCLQSLQGLLRRQR